MKKAKLYSTVGLILAAVIFLLATCTKMVDNSEIGIKFKKFSLTDQGELVANQVSGLTFFNPITTRVFTYPVFIQRVDFAPFTVTTKDAATFTMDPMMAYQLERSKAAYVFNKYRKSLREIEMGYIRTCIYDAYRISANNYTPEVSSLRHSVGHLEPFQADKWSSALLTHVECEAPLRVLLWREQSWGRGGGAGA